MFPSHYIALALRRQIWRNPPDSRQHHSRPPPEENPGKFCRKFKGIRMRKWGKWVSEIRMPRSTGRIWLGSYKTAEQAARAYDAALCCLRGPNAKFNFADSVPPIPSASSLSHQQIQDAAAKYALSEIPLTLSSLQNINNKNKRKEKPPSPSRWSLALETEWACDNGFQKLPSIDSEK